jgi:DNA-binding GntR family transcriptional regulator
VAGSLTERLTDELRAMVLDGRLAPGSVVVEPRLAEEFQVSKTPVREALRLLAAEGHVTVLPKKGYLVRTLTHQDLSDVLDMRLLLEPHAAASVAGFGEPERIASLRGALDRQRALSDSDPLAAMREARSFHESIARGSRNQRLAETLGRCFDETSRAHHVLLGMRGRAVSDQELAEHEAVYAAIASGDVPGARAAMADHLRSVRRSAAAQFEGTEVAAVEF